MCSWLPLKCLSLKNLRSLQNLLQPKFERCCSKKCLPKRSHHHFTKRTTSKPLTVPGPSPLHCLMIVFLPSVQRHHLEVTGLMPTYLLVDPTITTKSPTSFFLSLNMGRAMATQLSSTICPTLSSFNQSNPVSEPNCCHQYHQTPSCRG